MYFVSIKHTFFKAHQRYTARYLGFFLFVLNTTDKSDGFLFYKDRNLATGTIPAVLTPRVLHMNYIGTTSTNRKILWGFRNIRLMFKIVFPLFSCLLDGSVEIV